MSKRYCSVTLETVNKNGTLVSVAALTIVVSVMAGAGHAVILNQLKGESHLIPMDCSRAPNGRLIPSRLRMIGAGVGIPVSDVHVFSGPECGPIDSPWWQQIFLWEPF